MPKSSPRKLSGNSEQTTLLSVHEIIENWLRKMAQVWPKELSAEEINDWMRDLGGFPLQAIDYAFDNWRRSGHWFPDYASILDMCKAWEPDREYKPGCSKECLARHGRGYHWNDMRWLYGRMVKEIKAGKTINPDALLAELDNKRPDGAPEWRRV